MFFFKSYLLFFCVHFADKDVRDVAGGGAKGIKMDQNGFNIFFFAK